MTTDSSTTGDEQDAADSDGDPQEMPRQEQVTGAVDGAAEDDTDPGSDPDGDSREKTSS